MKKFYEEINFGNRKLSAIYHKDTIKEKNFTRIHWHESLELICINTETVIFYNGEEITGKPGDIIAINSNILHSFKTPSDNKSIYDCLILDVNLCNFFGFDIEKRFISRIIRDDKANEIMKKISTEIREEKKHFSSAVKFLAGELLVYLYRNHETEEKPVSVNKKSIALVKKVIAYSEKNYKKSVSLDEIASSVGYSKYYLIRTFKNSTGITLLDFINSLRIKEASRLLENKDLSINEIALASGFENQSYFSKVFKKHMGVCPSKYINKE